MCRECGYEERLDELERMLDDRFYSFAYSTLHGIAEWVTDKKHMTERQKEAMDNIERSVRGRP